MAKAIHRQIWEQHRGPIPKGWLIYHLNGDKMDNRLENLAALPRKAPHPGLIVAPYVGRIRKLERELKLSRKQMEER